MAPHQKDPMETELEKRQGQCIPADPRTEQVLQRLVLAFLRCQKPLARTCLSGESGERQRVSVSEKSAS